MQYLKFTKAQNKQAEKMHRKCWRKDQKKLRSGKLRDRIENGVYRAAGM